MFVEFFLTLKERGVPVSPTGFVRLHAALQEGLITSLADFYSLSRAIMIKSERYFDIYDNIFAHFFQGAELDDLDSDELDEAIKFLLDDWLKDPAKLADFLGMSQEQMNAMSPEELEEYFRQRLEEQSERHDGGNYWIGTSGTSPVGNSGYHPGGMRVGGRSRNQSAVKVAMERRYKDYNQNARIGAAQISDALKKLRHMVPSGPKDRLNVEETIYQTMKNAGEIEVVFDRRMKDKLKVVLMIDNGGYSMDPFVHIVQVLFTHAKAQFKDVKFYYFHNTIYSRVWADPRRREKAVLIEDFARLDPETRLIIVGDASMATWELLSRQGASHYNAPSQKPSIERLDFLAKTFKHSVWLNPKPAQRWAYSDTISTIMRLFPMFELTLDGLDAAAAHLMRSN